MDRPARGKGHLYLIKHLIHMTRMVLYVQHTFPFGCYLFISIFNAYLQSRLEMYFPYNYLGYHTEESTYLSVT